MLELQLLRQPGTQQRERPTTRQFLADDRSHGGHSTSVCVGALDATVHPVSRLGASLHGCMPGHTTPSMTGLSAMHQMREMRITKQEATARYSLRFNAQHRRSWCGALFVLLFERQRVTQKVRSTSCRPGAVC
jgi:hypothetical protein